MLPLIQAKEQPSQEFAKFSTIAIVTKLIMQLNKRERENEIGTDIYIKERVKNCTEIELISTFNEIFFFSSHAPLFALMKTYIFNFLIFRDKVAVNF